MELWLKIFIAIFCPVMASVIIAMIWGFVKQRDTIRDHGKCLKNDNEDIKDLQAKLEELKEKREKDLIESRSLEGINAIVDTKIKLETASLMKEIAQQHHEHVLLFTNALTQMEKNFTGALFQVEKTLEGVNSTVIQMGKEFERLRKTKENV